MKRLSQNYVKVKFVSPGFLFIFSLVDFIICLSLSLSFVWTPKGCDKDTNFLRKRRNCHPLFSPHLIIVSLSSFPHTLSPTNTHSISLSPSWLSFSLNLSLSIFRLLSQAVSWSFSLSLIMSSHYISLFFDLICIFHPLTLFHTSHLLSTFLSLFLFIYLHHVSYSYSDFMSSFLSLSLFLSFFWLNRYYCSTCL